MKNSSIEIKKDSIEISNPDFTFVYFLQLNYATLECFNKEHEAKIENFCREIIQSVKTFDKK